MTVTKLVHSCFFGNGESLKFNRCDIFASTLVLLCHKFRCLLWVAIGAAQHGHRDNVATRATTNFRRIESISEAEKKEDLAELEAALKNAKPVQFKENIALVAFIAASTKRMRASMALSRNQMTCQATERQATFLG